MRKRMNSDAVLQFRITLNQSTPRVWRRILVPADYTFFDLHCAIQNAMEWTDSHLHAFYLSESKKPNRITIEFPNPEEDVGLYPKETRDERKEYIANYFGKTIKRCIYCYDFGDNWDHAILFERTLPLDQKAIYPQCIAGQNACPPEDCGGVGGYEDLQKILKNPRHKEHEEMLEWLGLDDPRDFYPNEFDSKEIEFENPQKRLKEWERGFGVQTIT